MKNLKKIKRIQLSISEQDFPVVFGIVTPDPDYKLSLKLNKKLNISLRNTNPVEFRDIEGNMFIFSKFADTYTVPDSTFQLVSNRSAKNFLLKKLKNIDYLLIINDPEIKIRSENVLSQIREIESVTGVFKIEFKTLKDRNLKYLV